MKSFVPQMLVDSNDVYSTYINSSYLATLLLKLMWNTRIYYEETFHVKGSSNNAKYLKFYGREVVFTRNSNFGYYWEISDSNLETRGYGPKSGVSRIIRES